MTVYDGRRQPVQEPSVRELAEGNRLLTEIGMPGNHMAILVRAKEQRPR